MYLRLTRARKPSRRPNSRSRFSHLHRNIVTRFSQRSKFVDGMGTINESYKKEWTTLRKIRVRIVSNFFLFFFSSVSNEEYWKNFLTEMQTKTFSDPSRSRRWGKRKKSRIAGTTWESSKTNTHSTKSSKNFLQGAKKKEQERGRRSCARDFSIVRGVLILAP